MTATSRGPRTFTYSLISDMHLDHPQNKTPYDKLEENIIVAGDTINGLGGLKFLGKLQHKGFRVFAVDGNHEHYCNTSQNRTIGATSARFQAVHPNRWDIDETLTIILANGWYQVNDPFHWYNYMNDAKNCCGVDAIEAQREVHCQAMNDAEFFRQAMAGSPERKFIVVTHTAPCVETLDPRYEGSIGNDYYHSILMRQVLADHGKQIQIWNHGHTHHKNMASVDGVNIITNPRGYPRENPSWEPMTVIVEY